MNSIVQFPTPPDLESSTDFETNFQSPMVQAMLAQADQLVDFDLNTADIDELRLNTRMVITQAHYDKNRFQAIMQLLYAALSKQRKKELDKYLSSGKSDQKAAAKALAFNQAVQIIPKKFRSCLISPIKSL